MEVVSISSLHILITFLQEEMGFLILIFKILSFNAEDVIQSRIYFSL